MSEHPDMTKNEPSRLPVPGSEPHPDLAALGLGSHYRLPAGLAEEPASGLCLGRIVSRQATRFEIVTRHGRRWAGIAGRLGRSAASGAALPAIGDWVLARWSNPGDPREVGRICELCPRQTALTRQAPGGSGDSQILAANLEYLIIVWPLDHVDSRHPELQVRWGMVQRFMTLALAGSITPLLVLSKADLLPAASLDLVRDQVRLRWPKLPVFALSSLNPQTDRTVAGADSHDRLLACLPAGSTTALAGLSGAGKSSLLNALGNAGLARVQAIRDSDGKGRHTTTHRELFSLPNGALVIDSPGIRELGLVADSGDLAASFPVIGQLAQSCRFGDCRHEGEPGCAVLAALASGELPASVLDQYRKQTAELAWLSARQIKAAIRTNKHGPKSKDTGPRRLSEAEYREASADERKWKEISKFQKQLGRGMGRG